MPSGSVNSINTVRLIYLNIDKLLRPLAPDYLAPDYLAPDYLAPDYLAASSFTCG
ncbi:hypothetical protein L2735_00150 [Shewanella olleyana]|uniref:hypothetical protein n=1 Tax=Shewanella olleyana TaxID=135626 RepID=UPI002010655F|nr:hypothetical protein [Shewanella olleyana]MCL1065244.1 hypothetical protein [Shewanella olleyana]